MGALVTIGGTLEMLVTASSEKPSLVEPARVLLLKSGEVVACGAPHQVMTESALREVFGTDLMVDANPASGAPRVTPVAPGRSAGRSNKS